MGTIRYRTWGGKRAVVVDAASVEFGPAHVIFRDVDHRIILAERVEQVNELHQDEALGSATRGVRPPDTHQGDTEAGA